MRKIHSLQIEGRGNPVGPHRRIFQGRAGKYCPTCKTKQEIRISDHNYNLHFNPQEVTKDNPHQLRLARLEWELTQRKQLSVLCDDLTKSKKSVADDIEKKKTQLDNLQPQLRQILEVRIRYFSRSSKCYLY